MCARNSLTGLGSRPVIVGNGNAGTDSFMRGWRGVSDAICRMTSARVSCAEARRRAGGGERAWGVPGIETDCSHCGTEQAEERAEKVSQHTTSTSTRPQGKSHKWNDLRQ